jgi:hypothetical protein
MSSLLPSTEVPYLLTCNHFAFANAGKHMKEELSCQVCPDTPKRQIVKTVGRERDRRMS